MGPEASIYQKQACPLLRNLSDSEHPLGAGVGRGYAFGMEWVIERVIGAGVLIRESLLSDLSLFICENEKAP